MKFESNYHKI